MKQGLAYPALLCVPILLAFISPHAAADTRVKGRAGGGSVSTIVARLQAPRAALVGSKASIRLDLMEDGAPVVGPVQVHLAASGPAAFALEATVGRVIAGGGTNRVLLETADASAHIDLSAPSGSTVAITVEDAGSGEPIILEVLEDFESIDGGFTHAGGRDSWEWGVPTSDPPAGASGRRIWATNLRGGFTGINNPHENSYLETPAFLVPEGSGARFEFSHRRLAQAVCAVCSILVSTEGGDFEPVPGLSLLEVRHDEFRRESLDLGPFAGANIQIRFDFEAGGFFTSMGWAIDDVRLYAAERSIVFLDHPLDHDGDGTANEVESSRGTNPLIADTDGDGLPDGMETLSDPLVADSDAGGERDGAETRGGRNPLDPEDDLVATGDPVDIVDGEGRLWRIDGDGTFQVRDNELSIEADRFPEPREGLTDKRGESLWFGPVRVGRLDVTRNIFVPKSEGAFIRYVETLHNPGDSAVTTNVIISGVLDPGRDVRVAATSSGDAEFGAGDSWLVTKGYFEFGSNFPSDIFVLSGPSGRIGPPFLGLGGNGSYSWTYSVTVPPRATVGVMHFAAKHLDEAVARQRAIDLSDLRGRALDGLQGDFEILNFDPDRDRDGIPDSVELANSLDPTDTADGAGDLDNDGLTNLGEYRAGSEMRNPDTDGDSLLDGDEVNARDTDPTKADTDGDGRRDAVDPYPSALLVARLDFPPAALMGRPARVAVRLSPSRGPIRSSVPVTLRASGEAVFAAEAAAGILISGGGTGAVVLECLDGAAGIDLTAATAERVRLSLEDHAGYGVLFQGEILENFESSDGGFTHPTTGIQSYEDHWKWGAPAAGPKTARSGTKAWIADIGDYRLDSGYDYLLTPTYDLALYPDIRLEFWHWLARPWQEMVAVSVDGGEFAKFPKLEPARAHSGGYNPVRLDLTPHAGHAVRLRFSFSFDKNTSRGWFIDDFRIVGSRSILEVLDPSFDADGDAMANEEELARGTDPFRRDSDGDGLADPIETGTGALVDFHDTGTDPLSPDTDSGGMANGLEALLGLDAFGPGDDFVPFPIPKLVAASAGPNWVMERDGRLSGQSGAGVHFGARLFDGSLLPERWEGLAPAGADSVLIGPIPMGQLDLVRFVSAPQGEKFIRSIEIFRNPGPEPATALFTVMCSLGSGDRTEVLASSSGDRKFTVEDDWVVTHEVGSGGSRAISLVLAARPARIRYEGVNLDLQNWGRFFGWTYPVVVPPGETAAVIYYAAQSGSADEAVAKARELAALGGRALEGIPPELGRRLINFAYDSDSDGIPDVVESALGLDATDPADGAADFDFDGLTNFEEYLAGSNLRRSDTDADGLSDGDEVKNLGTDPVKADTDGDGITDGVDLFPSAIVGARIVLPATVLAGVPAPAFVRFTARGGPVAVPLRFTLKVDGTAKFGSESLQGSLIEGGGSGTVVLESAEGGAGIAFTSSSFGSLNFAVEDSAHVGMTFETELEEDFEISEGRFLHGGFFFGGTDPVIPDRWEWKLPLWGPAAAHSGRRAWATEVHFNIVISDASYLETPPYKLGNSTDLRCEFWHWYDMLRARDDGNVQISVDGGSFTRIPRTSNFVGSSGGYILSKIDLTDFAGKEVRLRYISSVLGWYIDDFRIAGAREPVRVVDPGIDGDGDGIETAAELAAGTSPVLDDTDGDGLADGAGDAASGGEGIFGTDALNADSDAGGTRDGLEVLLGLNPLVAEDDFRTEKLPLVLRDGSDFEWRLRVDGNVHEDLEQYFSVNREPFPGLDQAFISPSRELLWLGTFRLGGLQVSRLVFVPSTEEGFARFIEILHNPESRTLRARIEIGGRAAPTVIATSSGDTTVDSDDDWVVVSGRRNSRQQNLALVLAGTYGALRPTSAGYFSDGFGWRFDTDVPAGETVAIQYFAAECSDRETALRRAAELHRQEGRSREGISAFLRQRILNFARDFDGDGIPDEAETALGLDPRDALDGARDDDGDGLVNLEEFHAGTDLRRADTDGDGLSDFEERRVAGTDPLKSDGDGVSDSADPYPRTAVVALLDLPAWALTGSPVRVKVRLMADGGPFTTPLKFTLRALGNVTFGVETAAGSLIEGGGTNAVLLETNESGEVALDFTASREELLRFVVEDAEARGIVQRSEVFEDFENSDGGFTHGGEADLWTWGAPSSGPRFARSGTKVWGTRTEGDFRNNPITFLETPAYVLSPEPPVALEFWHWHSVVEGRLLLSVGGGPFLSIPGIGPFRERNHRYRKVAVDLSENAGHSVKFRFEVVTGGLGVAHDGWFIDDFKITGPRAAVQALDPAADLDVDGVPSGEEAQAGTDPLSSDTDGDGLIDGVETSRGTSPLKADTDGAGMADGEEVLLGLDPNKADDDYVAADAPPTLIDGDGRTWRFQVNGVIDADVMTLSVGERVLSPLDPVRLDPKGERFIVGPADAGNLDVTRMIFVPSTVPGFVRYLEVIRNPSKVPAMTRVYIAGGAEGSHLYATSSGDQEFTPKDDWVLRGEYRRPDQPAGAVVNAGRHGMLRHTETWGRPGGLWSAYDLVVPAGETFVLLHFILWGKDVASTTSHAEALVRLEGRAREGIETPLWRRIVNFGVDLDADGIPDHAEIASGTDLRDSGDAGLDLDGDSLTNLEEFLAGSNPRAADSDLDGLSDATEVKEKGTNPALADTDGDGRGDATDPFAASVILARLEQPPAAVVGVPTPVRVRLLVGESLVQVPVPFVLEVGGGAEFSETAILGTVLDGGGTGRVRLLSDGGEVAIGVTPQGEEPLSFALEDPEDWGIVFQAEIFEDFESDDGGFTHGGSGDDWAWGIPTTGPRRGHSGRRLWATNLHGNYKNNAGSYIETPAYTLPAVSSLTLEFWHWMATFGNDQGRFFLSIDGGSFESFPGRYPLNVTKGTFERATYDLTAYAGRRVKFQFYLYTDAADTDEGWYIDDFRIFGPLLEVQAKAPGFGKSPPLPVLSQTGDFDKDGLANREEVLAGTNPFLRDTDTGGIVDGDEVAQGLDPLDPSDDSKWQAPFIRGDADGSMRLDITDAITILYYLFLGGPKPMPLDAADVDDNGRVEITDPIGLLDYMFLGGEAPRAPFPDPGPDPTADGIDS